jgi:hypothetical protein
MDYLTTRTSLSPIRCRFAPSFVNYKKGCSRLATSSDKVYQLFAHGRWFSPGTLASSTTKTCRHDIADILLKVAFNTINQNKTKRFCKVHIYFFLGYLTDFSYFSAKIAEHNQNRSKMTFLKGCVNGFSYFSLIYGN